jgi:hypothetical protein
MTMQIQTPTPTPTTQRQRGCGSQQSTVDSKFASAVSYE